MKEYPNYLLSSSTISKNDPQLDTNLFSSTENFWVSKSMFKKWNFYRDLQGIQLNIYSNAQVNNFMKEYFQEDLIYEIYRKSVLPVQKIDIFRICVVFKFGGIWLDLKSQINLEKVLELYEESKSNGLLLYEPREIEITKSLGKEHFKTHKRVIHNGFFYLPKGSEFLRNLLFRIKKDYLYFQDIVFNYPKQGIMNLTGPHQFTRTFHGMEKNKRPRMVSQNEIDWIYFSKYGEFISPIKGLKHYSYLRNMKTIDSKINTDLRE